MNWLGEDYKSALSILKQINNNDYDFHPVSPEIGKVSNDNKNILEVYHHKKNEISLFPNLF
jgi:putative SOS response-associated peptidase YedK